MSGEPSGAFSAASRTVAASSSCFAGTLYFLASSLVARFFSVARVSRATLPPVCFACFAAVAAAVRAALASGSVTVSAIFSSSIALRTVCSGTPAAFAAALRTLAGSSDLFFVVGVSTTSEVLVLPLALASALMFQENGTNRVCQI